MAPARLSVVIPAHNEAVLLSRLLSTLLSTDRDDELDIVVVANGCTDDTAAIARAASPRVTVVELDVASKVAALNAGDAATDVFPRAYVDADVLVDAAALLALAHVLESDALAAAPTFVVDASASNAAVRSYFRVWALSPYRTNALIGAGVYAVSAEGRARFGAFPELIADDLFVQELFAVDERSVLADHSFSVEAPHTVPALVGRLTRSTLGNEQLRATVPPGPGAATAGTRELLARVARTPSVWPSFPAYALIYLRARREARRLLGSGATPVWTRDETTRTAGA